MKYFQWIDRQWMGYIRWGNQSQSRGLNGKQFRNVILAFIELKSKTELGMKNWFCVDPINLEKIFEWLHERKNLSNF